MSQVTIASWTDAHNATTSAADPTDIVQGDLPVFEEGQVVFFLNDIPADASDGDVITEKYTIEAVVEIYKTVSTVTEILDQRLDFANPADGAATIATVQGFQHDDSTGVPSGVVGDTASRPYFYDIVRLRDGDIQRRIHQSQLTDTASWETFAAGKIPAIIV